MIALRWLERTRRHDEITDGYWHLRPGLTPHYPVQLHEVEVEPDALTVYGSTTRLTHRGDTLNTPLLTVRFSSPMPDVIRVQWSHHTGRRLKEPRFELQERPVPAVEDARRRASGDVDQRTPERAGRKGRRLADDFKDGERVVTSSGWRGMGFVDTNEGRYIHEQLELGVGECVYGLGERFTAFVQNGQVVDLWNADGGTSSEQAYKNVSFYLTNRNYGVFVNHPEMVSFEIGSEKVKRVQFSVPGEHLEYFVIYGPSPKDVLVRYTALTGRPALPPAWSFGLWLTTSFTTNYDEATVTS
jgi:alpha-D-xyloside xylohydrolase